MDLFDPALTRTLVAAEPFLLRPLRSTDYHLGYISVLAQLSKTGWRLRLFWYADEPPNSHLGMFFFEGDYSEALFQRRFELMQRCNTVFPTYLILVVEDTARHCIVGCASLIIEVKFWRGGKDAGHIEDVVTDKSVRGLGIGKLLIDSLITLASMVGCYKVLLDCSEDNVPFYERCGLKRKEVQMVRYLDETPQKAKL
jgi:glucosamine-phosphate N-acetyltransferase